MSEYFVNNFSGSFQNQGKMTIVKYIEIGIVIISKKIQSKQPRTHRNNPKVNFRKYEDLRILFLN